MSRRYVARGKTPVTPPGSRPGPLTTSRALPSSGVGPAPGRAATAVIATVQGETACPGPCNAAFRRAEEVWAATGRDHDVPFRPGCPVWCESTYDRALDGRCLTTTQTHYGCRDRIADAMVDIGHWIGDMPTSGALMMAAPPERRGTGSPPSPSPAFDEREAFDRWLDDVAGRLAARAGHAKPKPHRQLGYLGEWLTALLSGPHAQLDGQSVLDWQRRLRAIVGAQTVTRMPGPCSACDARGSLRHRNGSGLIRCVACSAVIEWDAYHAAIVGADVAPSESTSAATKSTRRTA